MVFAALVSLTLWLPASAAPPPPVVGGAPAPEGAWPDAAVVYQGSMAECSGVLISPDLVLTAGHCAEGVTRVIVGTVDYAVGGEEILVGRTWVHPDAATTYDVALLQLAVPARTAYRALALDCVRDAALADDAPVEIVGFGATNTSGTARGTVLQQAATTVVDADCSELGYGCFAAVSPGGELVAGGDGVDSCYGDSGGPLYLLTEVGELLIGVASRGVLDGETPCGSGGIYVRVDTIAPWIEETSGETLDRPACEGETAGESAGGGEADEVDGCGCAVGGGGGAGLASGGLGGGLDGGLGGGLGGGAAFGLAWVAFGRARWRPGPRGSAGRRPKKDLECLSPLRPRRRSMLTDADHDPLPPTDLDRRG